MQASTFYLSCIPFKKDANKNGARTERAWFLMRITADWYSCISFLGKSVTGYRYSRLVYRDFVTDFIEVDLWQV